MYAKYYALFPIRNEIVLRLCLSYFVCGILNDLTHLAMESTPPGSCLPGSSRMNAHTPDLTSDSEYFSVREYQPDSDEDLEPRRSSNIPPTPETVEPVPAAVDAAVQLDPPTPTRDARVQTTMTESLSIALNSPQSPAVESGLLGVTMP